MGKPTDAQYAWTAEFLEIDEARLRSETVMQLLFEQQTLQDKLAKPADYRGREHDEAERGAIGDELSRRKAQAAADKRVQDLIADSKQELGELSVDTGSLDQDFNGKMIQQYQALRIELDDQVTSNEAIMKSGQQPDEAVLQSWSEALYETGGMRRTLQGNLDVDATTGLKAAQSQLDQSIADLNRAMKSAQAVKDAIAQAEDGEKWVGRMLKLKEVAETIEGKGTAIKEAALELGKTEIVDRVKSALWDKVTGGADEIMDESAAIEKGIENLGDYSIQLELAGQGFTSVAELQRLIANRTEAVRKAGAALKAAAAKKRRSEALYVQPTKGSPRR